MLCFHIPEAGTVAIPVPYLRSKIKTPSGASHAPYLLPASQIYDLILNCRVILGRCSNGCFQATGLNSYLDAKEFLFEGNTSSGQFRGVFSVTRSQRQVVPQYQRASLAFIRS